MDLITCQMTGFTIITQRWVPENEDLFKKEDIGCEAHVSGLADLLAQFELWKSGNKLTTVFWHRQALWTKIHNCYDRHKERLARESER